MPLSDSVLPPGLLGSVSTTVGAPVEGPILLTGRTRLPVVLFISPYLYSLNQFSKFLPVRVTMYTKECMYYSVLTYFLTPRT